MCFEQLNQPDGRRRRGRGNRQSGQHHSAMGIV
jgi:hypothetical protein